jgi:hypothetical protein
VLLPGNARIASMTMFPFPDRQMRGGGSAITTELLQGAGPFTTSRGRGESWNSNILLIVDPNSVGLMIRAVC